MFVSFKTEIYLEWWYLVREASLIIFHKYYNYLFINELDECLCIVWCSINVCEWCGVWSGHSIFRKGDTRVEIIRMCIVWGFKEVSWLSWYIGFTWMKITDKWRVEGGSNGLVWGLKYEPDQNRLFWGLKYEHDRNSWVAYDRCTPLSLTQCTSVFRK